MSDVGAEVGATRKVKGAVKDTALVRVGPPPVFPCDPSGVNVLVAIGRKKTINLGNFESLTLELRVEWPVLPTREAVAEAETAGQRYVHDRIHEVEAFYRKQRSQPVADPFTRGAK